MQLIENTSDLNNLCRDLAQREFVCIDLEFLREHTYFAKLCLIQVASEQESAIIDPLAPHIDLRSFFELMQNPNVVKVFHSGRQDIEIIYNMCGHTPKPLFDTQIAAQAAGFGESVGYETLVDYILQIALDKSSRLSDWSKRPLSETQLNYALSDVTHLVHLYTYLKNWLIEQNRLEWIQEEIDALGDENLYRIEPDEMWQRIRHHSHNALFLTTLRALTAWREKRAIDKNVPRQSFVKDDLLLNICASHPMCKEDLATIRGMRPDLASGKIGDEIIAVMQQVQQLDKKDYVVPPKGRDLRNADGALLELLKMLLKITAQQQKIVPKMLASEDDLKLFCRDHTADVPFLQGWRYEIFGQSAQKLACGKTGITYNPRKKHIDFIDVLK
jgi:ribonuclease D